MSETQYTIRSVPKNLDDFLRKQALSSGKSLNRVVLDYLAQSTKLDLEASEDNFSWIIGADTMSKETLNAIKELKLADKKKQLK